MSLNVRSRFATPSDLCGGAGASVVLDSRRALCSINGTTSSARALAAAMAAIQRLFITDLQFPVSSFSGSLHCHHASRRSRLAGPRREAGSMRIGANVTHDRRQLGWPCPREKNVRPISAGPDDRFMTELLDQLLLLVQRPERVRHDEYG